MWLRPTSINKDKSQEANWGKISFNIFRGKRLFSLKYKILLKVNKENTPNPLEQYRLKGISMKKKKTHMAWLISRWKDAQSFSQINAN